MKCCYESGFMSARELMLDYSLHILAIYKFPLKIADFIDASFFALSFPLGRSLYEKKKGLFPSWIWLKAGTRKWLGCEIASASNLKLFESSNAFSTIYTLLVGTAHHMACWGRLTCNILPLLNFQPEHTYFLITIWGVFAEMAVCITCPAYLKPKIRSFARLFVAENEENSFQTRTKNINDKNWVLKWDWTNKNGTKWVYSHEHCGTRPTYTISNAHRQYHRTLYLAFYFIITCSFLSSSFTLMGVLIRSFVPKRVERLSCTFWMKHIFSKLNE